MMNFEEVYINSIKTSKGLVEDVRFSRALNMEPIRNCAYEICEILFTNMNLFYELNTIQDKYPYLYSHPVNVACIAYVIGKWINLNFSELYNLVCCGLLHDIGKAKIRDSLLNKTETLTAKELEIMRTHPAIGYQLLEKLGGLESDILEGILFHHERHDGSGYPIGLKGTSINLFARIIAIADIFDAMTANKSYRQKESPFRAIEEIQNYGFGSLDPYICQVFMNHITYHYCGCFVRLNNEQIGKIVYINPEEKTKPLIRCNNEFLSMSVERDLQILEVITDLSHAT
jgi:HD-GYP domain-containing protein (c-di-GMP phosphodiesterase class II)